MHPTGPESAQDIVDGPLIEIVGDIMLSGVEPKTPPPPPPQLARINVEIIM